LIDDDVIRSVGSALTSCVRATDKVARFGGEEFVVLLHEIGDAPRISSSAPMTACTKQRRPDETGWPWRRRPSNPRFSVKPLRYAHATPAVPICAS
jgi:GGDEF domain-containing protein